MAFVGSIPLRHSRASNCDILRQNRTAYAPSKRRRCVKALLTSFSPSDFEIRRLVGQQGYATITDWEYYTTRDPLAPTRTVESSSPSIRLYEAIIKSPTALYNSRVLLKEFLSDGVQLGVNEAEAYKNLYEAGSGTAGVDPDVVPVATLLGTFQTDDSFSSPIFASQWRVRFPNSPEPPAPGAPFLVFRWEGLQTGLSCAAARRQSDEIGNAFFDKLFPRNLEQRQSLFIRAFMKRAAEALFYLHSTGGIVHRSMGLASIMVNTIEYRLASNLLVKIRDLGFAKPVSDLVTGEGLERARKAGAVSPAAISAFYFAEDIYALGYAFLEIIFSVFSGRPVTQDTFKKLFEDTFDLDVKSFRNYCKEDPDWNGAVEFLDRDDGQGWQLHEKMLSAREKFTDVSMEVIRNHPFLDNDR